MFGGRCLSKLCAVMLVVLLARSSAQEIKAANITALKQIFSDVFAKTGILPDHPFSSSRLQLRNGVTSKCFHVNVRSRNTKNENMFISRTCKSNDTFQQMIWLRPIGDTGFVALAAGDNICAGNGRNGTNYLITNYEKACLTDSRTQFAVIRERHYVIFKQRNSGRCISVSKIPVYGMDPLITNVCASEEMGQRWYLCKLHGQFSAKKCWPP